MKKLIFILLMAFAFQLAMSVGFNYKITENIKYVSKDVENLVGKVYKREAFENRLEFDIKYDSFRAYVEYQFYKPKEVIFGTGNGEDRNSIEKFFIEYKRKGILTRFGTLNPVFNRGVILDAIIDEDVDIDNTLIGGYFRFRKNGIMFECVGGDQKEEDISSSHESGISFGANFNYKLHKMFKPGITYFYNEYKLNSEDMKNSLLGFNAAFSFDNIDLYAEYAMQMEDRDEDETALFASMSYYFGNFSGIVEYKQYKNFAYHFNNLPTANYPGEDLAGIETGIDEIGYQAEVNYNFDSGEIMKLNYSECWDEDKKLEQSIIFSEFSGKIDKTFYTFDIQKMEEKNTYDNKWESELKPGVKVSFPLSGEISAELIHYYTIKEYENDPEHIAPKYLEPEITIGLGYKWLSVATRIMRESWDEETTNYSNWPPVVDKEEKTEYWVGTEIVLDMDIYGKLSGFIGKEKGGKTCRGGT